MCTNFYTYAKRIMVVEDDRVALRRVQRCLTDAGFQVTGVDSGEAALEAIRRRGVPHLMVVDINLPGISGVELCRRVSDQVDVPILVVTDQVNYECALATLEAYADDFMLKPFNMTELAMRVGRILRRIQSFDYVHAHAFCVDADLKVNLYRQQVEVEGKTIMLTPVENKLLGILLRNPNRALTYRMLLDVIWPNEEVSDDALRVQVHRLRSKLRGNCSPSSYIQTERGIGYRLVVGGGMRMEYDLPV